MEFNTLIKEQLFPLFQKKGYKKSEELNNILRLESSILKVNIVYNNYDKTCLFEIGKRGGILYPINDNVVRSIFKSELQIDYVTPEVFVQNLVLLFQQKEGIEILGGNITDLENFIKQECSIYTQKLIMKQALEIASNAWMNKDYKTFIACIDKLIFDELPEPFKLKYKIAKQVT